MERGHLEEFRNRRKRVGAKPAFGGCLEHGVNAWGRSSRSSRKRLTVEALSEGEA